MIYLKSLAQCLAKSKPWLNSNPRGFRNNLEFVLLWSLLFSQALVRPFWQFTVCRHIYLARCPQFALIDSDATSFHPYLCPWKLPHIFCFSGFLCPPVPYWVGQWEGEEGNQRTGGSEVMVSMTPITSFLDHHSLAISLLLKVTTADRWISLYSLVLDSNEFLVPLFLQSVSDKGLLWLLCPMALHFIVS